MLKSEFAKNVLTLMTGTTIAQAIPIAISPILTRIYTPEDFGVLALYVAIVSIFSSIVSARYELAIMLPKKDIDSLRILVISLSINFILSSILLLIVILFHDIILRIIDYNKISLLLYIMPFNIFIIGAAKSLIYWANRNKNYRLLSQNTILNSSLISSANLSFGFLKFGGFGLIFAQIFANIVSLVFLLKKLNMKFSNIKVSKVNFIALLKKYKKMPIYSLPNVILDSFKESGTIFLISALFTSSTLGQFSLATRVVRMPSALIGSSLTSVFFEKVSKCKEDELYGVVKNFLFKSFLIAAPIFTLIFFLSEYIFTIIFGENWSIAGKITSIITPWLFTEFLASPMANVLISINKQEIILIASILYAIIPISLLVILKNFEFLFILQMINLTMSIFLVCYIFFIIFYIRSKNYE